MITPGFRADLAATLAALDEAGGGAARVIATAQRAVVGLAGGGEAINLCANNYLGLADHPALKAAATDALERHGIGMASVRFVSGTHSLHAALEVAIADYLGQQDAVLFGSCFDANAGLFEALLGERDAVVSDALNHASIIDGIRLCKAARHRYAHADMADLERKLAAARAAGARHLLIATDGVFSMDGSIAPLPAISRLAAAHGALLMVDDSHATGVVGPGGAGTPALFDLTDRVDIVTGTLGKALGGGMGGFVATRAEIAALLRRRARPYVFSNALPPMLCAAGLEAIRTAREGDGLRATLHDNARHWRAGLAALGFRVPEGSHPIVPVLIGDDRRAAGLAAGLFAQGVYVQDFRFPVVPPGQARIRTQVTAGHSRDQLDRALAAFAAVGRRVGVIEGMALQMPVASWVPEPSAGADSPG